MPKRYLKNKSKNVTSTCPIYNLIKEEGNKPYKVFTVEILRELIDTIQSKNK